MSIFDLPRINFTGMITLNPGTANNDDYSGTFQQPGTGQNLALIDSATVQPHDFNGLSDGELVDWIQKEHSFQSTSTPSQTQQIIPAEWNYYGDMSVTAQGAITGVQVGADNPDRAALETLVGKPVSWNGNITDVNSEGSPPATQFFVQELVVGGNGIPKQVAKAACLWIYFTRNVNLTTDAGAGGYMYHVIPGGHTHLPGFSDPDITGLVFRYCLFAEHGSTGNNDKIMEIYRQKGTNPATFQVTGSVAPLFAGETNTFGPVGRFLSSYTPNINVPAGNANNANCGNRNLPANIALGPAVVHARDQRVSIECLATFPEQYDARTEVSWDQPSKKNPKYDFGKTDLEVYAGSESAVISEIAYTDLAAGNACGWVFDYDLSGNAAANKLLSNPDAAFRLRLKNPDKVVLDEEPYFITTNQLAIYAEEGGSTTEFLNQGMPAEPMTISVYHRGKALTAAECPDITGWRYQTTPLMAVTRREPLGDTLKPGTPISAGTSTAGNYLFTFAVTGDGNFIPPDIYNDYIAPPFTTLTNRPSVSLRILPNIDFSQYWTDGPDGPVGNDKLTFDVVYQHVLRNYFVLFPAMNAICPMNDPEKLANIARQILIRTDPSLWMSSGYMPITRDLSDSRRTLLQAWCRKMLAAAEI